MGFAPKKIHFDLKIVADIKIKINTSNRGYMANVVFQYTPGFSKDSK